MEARGRRKLSLNQITYYCLQYAFAAYLAGNGQESRCASSDDIGNSRDADMGAAHATSPATGATVEKRQET